MFIKVADFTRQKRQLDEKLSRKESELEIVRHELHQVKEFQKKKAQMQKELEEVNFFIFHLEIFHH
jgi:hypothetical protein